MKYKLTKATDGKSFKAYTEIGSTTYYLTVPTSNTFTMATSNTAAGTDMIIGTTQVSGTNYAVANKGTTARHLRLNGTSGLRSYAGTTGTMAFFYKVVPDGPTVSSITIKTPPTKTTYMVWDTFDPTGLVITKTMSDDTTEDVVYNKDTKDDFTFNPTLDTELKNETSVDITYGRKTVKQNITVTPFVVTAGTYNISTNDSLYGVSTGNNSTEQSTNKKGVTIVSGCLPTAQTKTYYDAKHIRYYIDSYMKLTAPAGFVITQVDFTEPSSDKKWDATNDADVTVNTGKYTNSSKEWSGASRQVNFNFHKQCRVASVSVTYMALSSNLNTSGLSTFSAEEDVDITGATAYKASVDGNVITLTPIGTSIPANVGVILFGEAGTSVIISPAVSPVAEVEGNDLKASSVEVEDGYAAWVLNGNQFLKYEGALVPNKAYLAMPTNFEVSANTLSLVFDENVATGIETFAVKLNNSDAYNLAGQRVSANAKGIVIINGKKLLNK